MPLVARPAWFAAAMVVFTASLLALDHFVGKTGQVALAGLTVAVLLAACAVQSPERRLQTAVVVLVATVFEVIGSVIWGLYRYRLGNLPPFVPPAHGLVYLTGAAISQTAAVVRRPRVFVGAVLAAGVGWALAGLTVLPRMDVLGAIGMLVFVAFVVFGRAPTVLCGVFVAVGLLELYGTAIGTWQWQATVPGLGLPDGNPPSGAVSGYVLFDLVALACAPPLLARARALADRPRSTVVAAAGQSA